MSASVSRLVRVSVAFFGAVSLCVASVTVERSVGEAKISRLVSLPTTDLVVVDSGFEAGFRQGMVCTVTRDGTQLGQLLLVELRPQAANALILDLSTGQGFQVGDLVAVKTVSTRK